MAVVLFPVVKHKPQAGCRQAGQASVCWSMQQRYQTVCTNQISYIPVHTYIPTYIYTYVNRFYYLLLLPHDNKVSIYLHMYYTYLVILTMGKGMMPPRIRMYSR